MVWSIALGEGDGRAFLLKVSLKECVKSVIYPKLPIDEKVAVQFVSNLVKIPVSSPGLLWNFF